MPRGKSQDTSLLAMALVGYEIEKKRIEDKIMEIRSRLGRGRIITKNGATPNSDQPKRRKLSVAARKRIAAAQKKRWAEHRKAVAQAGKS